MAKNRSINPENQSLRDKNAQASSAENGFNKNGNSGLQPGIVNTKGKR